MGVPRLYYADCPHVVQFGDPEMAYFEPKMAYFELKCHFEPSEEPYIS